MIFGPEYGTLAWSDFRRGKVTASRFDDVMTEGVGKAPNKARYGKGALTYLRELVAATITGVDKVGGSSRAMERGIDMEQDAIDYYANSRFIEVGPGRLLVIDDTIIGATPDGFVDDPVRGLGTLQVKCPNSDNHLETIMTKRVPDQYAYQIQGELWVSERVWCDYVSFDDRFPDPLKMVVIPVARNEEVIAEMSERVHEFANMVNSQVEHLLEVIRAVSPEQADAIFAALSAGYEEVDEPAELDF